MQITAKAWMRHGVRKLVVLAAIVGSFAAFPLPAQGDDCSTNSNGVANSNGAATTAATQACAPAWGSKAGDHTGRKVG
jgi:hypothetical protein